MATRQFTFLLDGDGAGALGYRALVSDLWWPKARVAPLPAQPVEANVTTITPSEAQELVAGEGADLYGRVDEHVERTAPPAAPGEVE